MDIAGTAAIVAGGASGLGAATAAGLARAGAKVAILDLDGDKAAATAASIGACAVACDVTSEQSMRAGLAEAAAKNGAARIVVNCAGIAPAARILGKSGPHDLAMFTKVVTVNLIGTFNVLRLAAQAMDTLDPRADGERGVIVNTASIAAFEGQIGQAAYAASKAGIAGLTLPVARDLARHGIRVVTIAPGLFRTPMLLDLPAETQASLGASVPFPARLGDPTEFADLVMHICQNRMINGEVIRLDGALRLAPQ